MIKISRMADYAVVVLANMAGSETAHVNAGGLACGTGLPEPTVAKVLKLLSKAGVVKSIRGAGGGYTLARAAVEVTVADIVIAIDGPISLTACVEGSATSCDYAVCCPVSGRWDQVNESVRLALEEVTLADMMVKAGSCAGKKMMKGNYEYI